jgi:hypothetical protein
VRGFAKRSYAIRATFRNTIALLFGLKPASHFPGLTLQCRPVVLEPARVFSKSALPQGLKAAGHRLS